MEGGQVLAMEEGGEAGHGCHRGRVASGFQVAIVVVVWEMGCSPLNEAMLLVVGVWSAWLAGPDKEDLGALRDPPRHSAGKSQDGSQGPDPCNIKEEYMLHNILIRKRTRNEQGGNRAEYTVHTLACDYERKQYCRDSQPFWCHGTANYGYRL